MSCGASSKAWTATPASPLPPIEANLRALDRFVVVHGRAVIPSFDDTAVRFVASSIGKEIEGVRGIVPDPCGHSGAGSGIQVMLAANVNLQHADSIELFSTMFSAKHYRDSTTGYCAPQRGYSESRWQMSQEQEG